MAFSFRAQSFIALYGASFLGLNPIVTDINIIIKLGLMLTNRHSRWEETGLMVGMQKCNGQPFIRT